MTILNMLPLQGDEKERFEALAPEADHIYAGRRSVTPEQLARAEVILGWPRARDLCHAANLKWLHSLWAGTDEYTAPGILPEGVRLTSSAGTNARSVAEHMLASLLALFRQLPLCQDQQRAHLWREMKEMRTLLNAQVLVVGAGHVGSVFAGMCQGLGAHTTGLKRTVRGDIPGFDRVRPISELDILLPEADVVALTLPQTPETIGLMNRERIGLMKEGAVLLSAGRGTALDQKTLAQALQEGRLWGAALDVTDPEPLPEDHFLWDTPRLLLTPHVAGGMRLELTRKNCIELALENLRRYFNGEALKNRVQ